MEMGDQSGTSTGLITAIRTGTPIRISTFMDRMGYEEHRHLCGHKRNCPRVIA